MPFISPFMRALALATLVLTSISAVPASARDRTFIVSNATGLMFGTISNRGGLIGAAVPDRERAEAFEMIRLGGNRVAFRSLRNGSYLRAGVGQGTHLMSASPHVRGWETFEFVGQQGGVALRSVQNGRYLTVERNDAGLVSATADRIGPRELFRISTVSPPPAPPVAQGRTRIEGTYGFDLDTGRYTYDAQEDIWFVMERNGAYLQAKNGARLGARSNIPLSGEACRERGFGGGRIHLTAAILGTHVCVQTNAGHVSTVQIQDLSLLLPAQLTIGFLTVR
jgi:hypothetical protein